MIALIFYLYYLEIVGYGLDRTAGYEQTYIGSIGSVKTEPYVLYS